MRDYAIVSPLFWIRGSGKTLRGDPEARLVALYLSTSPTANMSGLYYLPLATIANDTGIAPKRVRDVLARIVEAGYASYDFAADLVWVHNHAQFDIGERMKPGDKRKGKLLAELRQFGSHPFVAKFYERYGEAFALGGCPIEGASMGHPIDDAIQGPVRSSTDPSPGPDPVVARAGPRDGSSVVSMFATTPREQRATRCPSSVAPADELAAWLQEWAIPADHAELPNFLDHHHAKGSSFRDWSAAWRTWQRNAHRFTPRSSTTPTREPPRQPLGDVESLPWFPSAVAGGGT